MEVSYNGAKYAGSQKQANANSVQAEMERALHIYFRKPFNLTGPSRTDAGVHAHQNYFHFDSDTEIESAKKGAAGLVYHLNAILPSDLAITKISPVHINAHCRFDALTREYRYYIYFTKDVFNIDRAYFYPFKLEESLLHAAAGIIKEQQLFTSFSKRSTQTNNFYCNIYESSWTVEDSRWVYTVCANRFLRGMVRGLVATMLRVGRGTISLTEFEKIFTACDLSLADFSAPARGLFLQAITYPDFIFQPNHSGIT